MRQPIRNSSAEYKEIVAQMAVSTLPICEDIMSEIRSQWETSFTPAEREGTGQTPGPLNWKHHLGECLAAITWRIATDVPTKYREGLLSKEDYVVNLELLEHTKKCIQKEISNVGRVISRNVN